MTEDEGVYADWDALRLIVPVAAALVVFGIVGLLAFQLLRPDPELSSTPAEQDSGPESLVPSTPEEAAGLVLTDFVGRLRSGDLAGLTFAFSEPIEAQQEFDEITAGLGGFAIEPVAGPVSIVDSANATAPLAVTWTLSDDVVFETVSKVDLVLIGTEWQIDWAPAVLEESLDPGDVLVRERVVAPRAQILGRGDVPLVDNRPVINVGVIPRQSDDIAGLSNSLGQLLGLDPGDIQAAIAPSPSDSVVPIAVRRVDDINPIRGALLAIPGVVLEDSTYPLTPDDRFGRALFGRAAQVTAEIIEESPEIFVAGDVAGLSGLQRLYNERLAGVPGFQVRVERRFPTPSPVTTPSDSVPEEGEEGADTPAEPEVPVDPDVIYLSAPVPGTPLVTTIDERTQRAAENALARTELPSALVAIEVSTGQVLAVANGPDAATSNFALTGQYPPGSIFKIVTAYAAMESGTGMSARVDCPETLNVNGREFRNAEGEALGEVALRRAFILSCNTAFINVSAGFDSSAFQSTALRFGVGQPYALGTSAFSGQVPIPGGPVDKAATSFGQSQVLFSPLSAAVMAATAAGGTYRPPQLVIDPDVPVGEPQPLDPNLTNDLQQAMRAVVTNGTGNAVAGVAGGQVSGKTGTAEFGDENPPRAHAWFVGYQGDVAFAVFVEGGEFGGATAAPIAGAFLNELARG